MKTQQRMFWRDLIQAVRFQKWKSNYLLEQREINYYAPSSIWNLFLDMHGEVFPKMWFSVAGGKENYE